MNETGWRHFKTLCLSIQDEEVLEHLFQLILTPEEKESIATRYLIIQELIKNKKTQRVIAKDLAVSIAKITRGSNELKPTSVSLINFLKNTMQGH